MVVVVGGGEVQEGARGPVLVSGCRFGRPCCRGPSTPARAWLPARGAAGWAPSPSWRLRKPSGGWGGALGRVRAASACRWTRGAEAARSPQRVGAVSDRAGRAAQLARPAEQLGEVGGRHRAPRSRREGEHLGRYRGDTGEIQGEHLLVPERAARRQRGRGRGRAAEATASLPAEQAARPGSVGAGWARGATEPGALGEAPRSGPAAASAGWRAPAPRKLA